MNRNRAIGRALVKIREHRTFLEFQAHIYNLLNFHRKGNNQDIFIFSSARGGSTWIQHIIASQPGIAEIFEPLHEKNWVFNTNRTLIEPSYEYILSNKDRKEAIKRYFDDIFSNNITNHFPMDFWSDTFTLRPQRYVVKFINGKELINWFEENYDILVVFFFRHPIATALSRMKLRWIPDFHERFFYMLKDHLFQDVAPSGLISYAESKLREGTELEKYVTGWCIEHYIPINFLKKDKWFILSYEELALDAAQVFSRLAESLDLTDVEKLTEYSNKPSESLVSMDFQRTKQWIEDPSREAKEELTKRWRQDVSADDENRAFEILDRFAISIYEKGSLTPNYASLGVSQTKNNLTECGNILEK